MNTGIAPRIWMFALIASFALLPAGCSNDNLVLTCGNGVKDIGETCDGDCPTGCSDGNPCTSDTLYGSADNCNVVCHFEPITTCWDGDWCCPEGCGPDTDVDCSPYCGNGQLDTGETCDGDCPTNCNDGNPCTVDILTGSASNCSSACSYEHITECASGDGCCPQGCSAKNDGDCSSSCGNGTLESGETCDPPSDCPADCDDGDPCTRDSLTGSAENCNAVCSHQPLFVCADGDECCPAGCNANTDGDCEPFCGNSALEEGEICDGNCPSQCNDGNPCTVDTMTGSPQTCDAVCSYEPLTDCNDADGCCPAECNANTDNDCSPSCGNEVIESGETCDPPSDCPADCEDGDPCTVDTMTGSAENCNVECSRTTITQCNDDDGCCLAACNANTDNDCNPFCGNNITEEGETCDGNCPTSCDDQDPCTVDALNGTPGDCNVTCTTQPLTECINYDQCCPHGCSHFNDADCEVCTAGFHPCDTGCCPWHIETVDVGDPAGRYSSLALDSVDNPQIAYMSYRDLKYAGWNGSGWVFQIVEAAQTANSEWIGMFTSLVLDGADNPHISYQKSYTDNGYWFALRYARWNGTEWNLQTVDEDGEVGIENSLALDSSGNPQISYRDQDNQNLKYARWTGSAWSIQTTDNNGDVGWYSSLALDSADNPHIFYYEGGVDANLKYARWNGTIWVIETVDSTGYVGTYPSLVLDDQDRPHIAYVESIGSATTILKYARWTGSQWEIQVVDTDGNVGQYCSLALDSVGNPHITYYDFMLNCDLKYARWNGSGWEIYRVDTAGDVGSHTSLALDANDEAHISYFDYTNTNLKYAHW